MKNIIFIAPPAAGKGTVSDYLVKKFGYLHISTGDLLRDTVASGSEFGKYIDSLISNGKYVPDEDMIKLMEQLEDFNSSHHIILDGFPRTLNQAKVLEKLLEEKNMQDYAVIYLEINMETAMKRALGRVSCPKCKKTYNIYYDNLKPINENLCDDCNVSLIHRSDDNEETFKKRFETYLESTSPVLNYYREKGVLKVIDAEIPIDNIFLEASSIATCEDDLSRLRSNEANND